MPDGPVEALGGGRRGRHGPPGQKRKAEDEDGGEDAGGKGRKDQIKGKGKGKDDSKQQSSGKPGKKGTKQSSGLKSAMDIRKQREIAQKVRCTAPAMFRTLLTSHCTTEKREERSKTPQVQKVISHPYIYVEPVLDCVLMYTLFTWVSKK